MPGQVVRYFGGGPSPQMMVLLLVHWQLQYTACCECTGCLSCVVAAGACLWDVHLVYGEMAQSRNLQTLMHHTIMHNQAAVSSQQNISLLCKTRCEIALPRHT